MSSYTDYTACVFNKTIDCVDKDKCLRCGWNPDVEKIRKMKIRGVKCGVIFVQSPRSSSSRQST